MIPADPTPCRARPDLFTTPEGERTGSDTYNARVSLAKRFCAVCPIRPACLVEARERCLEGVWGGEDDVDRAKAAGRRLKLPKAPRERAACGTRAARRRHMKHGEACAACVYQPSHKPAAPAAAA